ncbi:hypothetical protein FGIG_11545 [Fasciola gigantica]|uniref:Uncharacterized protein n=1 Tax=Fasciola gigantica TaxID=46835 RepID=A0A504Y657_FASGI|nr:hypothetical protein FGIG_11545 [Fasciola gigantica]
MPSAESPANCSYPSGRLLRQYQRLRGTLGPQTFTPGSESERHVVAARWSIRDVTGVSGTSSEPGSSQVQTFENALLQKCTLRHDFSGVGQRFLDRRATLSVASAKGDANTHKYSENSKISPRLPRKILPHGTTKGSDEDSTPRNEYGATGAINLVNYRPYAPLLFFQAESPDNLGVTGPSKTTS